MQGTKALLNNVYNMVQQHKSYALGKRLFKIEESLQHVNLKNNTVQEFTSQRNQAFLPEQVLIRVVMP